MGEEDSVQYLLYSLNLRELPAFSFAGQQSKLMKHLNIPPDVLQMLDTAQSSSKQTQRHTHLELQRLFFLTLQLARIRRRPRL